MAESTCDIFGTLRGLSVIRRLGHCCPSLTLVTLLRGSSIRADRSEVNMTLIILSKLISSVWVPRLIALRE